MCDETARRLGGTARPLRIKFYGKKRILTALAQEVWAGTGATAASELLAPKPKATQGIRFNEPEELEWNFPGSIGNATNIPLIRSINRGRRTPCEVLPTGRYPSSG